MCPSLIQIGSKTAEKNSAQTNKQTDRQTDRQTDTTKIMVTWPWTNYHTTAYAVIKQHMQSTNVVIHQRYTVLPVDSIQTFIYYDVADNFTLVVTMWLTLDSNKFRSQFGTKCSPYNIYASYHGDAVNSSLAEVVFHPAAHQQPSVLLFCLLLPYVIYGRPM